MIRRALCLLPLLALLAFGAFAQTPFLHRVRPALPFVLVFAAAVAGIALARPSRRRVALAAAVCASIALGVRGEAQQEEVRTRVLAAPAQAVALLGPHVIVGFDRFESVEPLAARAAVGGIFLTARNVQGSSVEDVRARIDRLQGIRSKYGLNPLLVMADQEGGKISRLSPPLPLLPPLSSVLAGSATEEHAFAYGALQGEGLAAMGVTVNLGPVVDVPVADAPLLDPYSRIATRAISPDPRKVASVAHAYALGLESHGVRATFKHFPGLGRASADTHFFRTEIAAPLAALEEHDWLPYRTALPGTHSLVMIGHVVVPALDPGNVASVSPSVVKALRGQLGDGLAITDDLCMAPITHGPGGIGGGAVAALNAGVDLVLISYDADQYFPAMDALLQAHTDGRLDLDTLAASDARLALFRAASPTAARPAP
jgi:beta-N-acetylhexosaminidase